MTTDAAGLVERLRERARIRRQIPTRKSVQNGEPDRIADLLEEAAAALSAAPEGWVSVDERLPGRDERVFLWIVPKPLNELPQDSSGKPIVSDFVPYRHEGKWGTWSPLSKATHWMPLPAAPANHDAKAGGE